MRDLLRRLDAARDTPCPFDRDVPEEDRFFSNHYRQLRAGPNANGKAVRKYPLTPQHWETFPFVKPVKPEE